MKASRVMLYLVLIVFVAFYLMPIYVLLMTSLKSFKEISLRTM